MLRFTFAVLILFALAAAGCSGTPEQLPPPTVVDDDVSEIDEAVTGPEGDPADVVSTTGTIVYVDLEGGFYGIVARDSTRYDPLNLADEFKQDGIHVRFRARKRDVMTTRMWGTPVHVEDMLRVEVLD